MSNTHFSFDTTAFRDTEELLSENINRIHGHELASWLSRELGRLGYEATDASDEDFGWYFDVQNEGHSYFCTASVATEGQLPDEGHVTVAKNRSLIDRILGRNKSVSDDAVVTAIAAILESSTAISNLERHVE